MLLLLLLQGALFDMIVSHVLKPDSDVTGGNDEPDEVFAGEEPLFSLPHANTVRPVCRSMHHNNNNNNNNNNTTTTKSSSAGCAVGVTSAACGVVLCRCRL